MGFGSPPSLFVWAMPDSLGRARQEAASCRDCDLWERATQTVFGEGSAGAELMLVGEQPGDQEDVTGKPFVGPAGRVLDEALAEAGIDRARVYVTNTVKHFKWEARGKRRIHQKPNAAEIHACWHWLEREVALVQPRLVVCLGATAAQAVISRDFKVTKDRGQFRASALGPEVTATIHPSAVLRAPDDASREETMRGLVADLRRVARRLKDPAA